MECSLPFPIEPRYKIGSSFLIRLVYTMCITTFIGLVLPNHHVDVLWDLCLHLWYLLSRKGLGPTVAWRGRQSGLCVSGCSSCVGSVETSRSLASARHALVPAPPVSLCARCRSDRLSLSIPFSSQVASICSLFALVSLKEAAQSGR